MKLTVLIERAESGLLKAWVIQKGQKGSQLLKGQISKLDTAKLQVQRNLQADTGHWVEITWEGVQE
jgi:hypothetical protein